MTDEAIKAFLANGGVIQQIPAGVSGVTEGSAYNMWGAPRKKAGRPPASDDVPPPTIDEPPGDDDDSDTEFA
jgi:hypothetical protein